MNIKTIFLVALLVIVVASERRLVRVQKSQVQPEKHSEEKLPKSTEVKVSENAGANVVENAEVEHDEEAEYKPDLSAHKPDKIAVIKTKSITSDLDGNYQYHFESSNGISSNEGGVAGQIVQGSTTWIAKNGEPLAISYSI